MVSTPSASDLYAATPVESSIARPALRSGLRRRLLASTAGLGMLCTADAFAQLPTDGTFVHGQGSIASDGGAMAVHQTSAAGVVHWTSFSIGQGNTVAFDNGAGATLNRVTGGGQQVMLTSDGSDGHLLIDGAALSNVGGLGFNVMLRSRNGGVVTLGADGEGNPTVDFGQTFLAGGGVSAFTGTLEADAYWVQSYSDDFHVILAGPPVSEETQQMIDQLTTQISQMEPGDPVGSTFNVEIPEMGVSDENGITSGGNRNGNGLPILLIDQESDDEEDDDEAGPSLLINASL